MGVLILGNKSVVKRKSYITMLVFISTIIILFLIVNMNENSSKIKVKGGEGYGMFDKATRIEIIFNDNEYIVSNPDEIEQIIRLCRQNWEPSNTHITKEDCDMCVKFIGTDTEVCVNDKNIYTCNTLNGDSYINKCSKENNQVVSEKIEGVYVSKLLCSKDMLFAFATTKYGKEMNSYIYIYDAEELSFDEKIDITNYGGTHYKAILFDNNILFSNSVDSGDHPCNTVCIYSINDKTIETISFDQYYPLDLAVWDNILIVSHFDLVKREGGSISIYNLETKELNNIELGHDVEQMTINENVIYILSDKIIYQYELKDMNLYLKCKTQIKKSNEENYLSGIFYIKPESMKFTL